MSTTARYWREIPQRYRTEASRCKGCGKVWFPPRIVCAGCGGRDFERVNLPDRGTVETFTVIRVGQSGFNDLVPYPIGVVELDGGVRIQCQITDCSPEEIEIGMPVRIEFRKVKEDGEAGLICYGYKALPVRDS